MKDPAVRDVRWRIEAIPSAELTAARPARQAIVEIDCADGRRLSYRTRTVLGTPDNPMTEAQVEAKARDLIAPVLGDTQTRSEEHTSELQSLMRITNTVFCLIIKKSKI